MNSLIVKSDERNISYAAFNSWQCLNLLNVKKSGQKNLDSKPLLFKVFICYEQIEQKTDKNKKWQITFSDAILEQNPALKVLLVDKTNNTIRTVVLELKQQLLVNKQYFFGTPDKVYRFLYEFDMASTEKAYILDFDVKPNSMINYINEVFVVGPEYGVAPFWLVEISQPEENFEVYQIKEDIIFGGSILTNFLNHSVLVSLEMTENKFSVSSQEIDGQIVHTVIRFDGGETHFEILLEPNDKIISETTFNWSSVDFIEVKCLAPKNFKEKSFLSKLKSLFYHS